MLRRPPGSNRTDTLFPYAALFRSRRPCALSACGGGGWLEGPDGGPPRRVRTTEGEALPEVDAGVAERVGRLALLHALGDDRGADVLCEGDERRDQRPAGRVLVETGDDRLIELEEVDRKSTRLNSST